MLIIQTSYPPNYDEIEEAFDLEGKKPVFAYGATLYNPHGVDIDSALLEHEMEHARRQGDDPEAWWRSYIDDPDFRCLEELVAYAKQYLYFSQYERDANRRAIYMHKLAKELSSPMYGNMITYIEALKALRHGTKNQRRQQDI